MDDQLRSYIRMILDEVLSENPRVASQLVRDQSKQAPENKAEKDSEEDEELDEFSGAGAIAGFSLPLGMSPDLPVPGSKSRKKSVKRKNPSWA